MKRIVTKQIAGVTDVATPRIKDALAAGLRRAERRDLLHAQIKRSAI